MQPVPLDKRKDVLWTGGLWVRQQHSILFLFFPDVSRIWLGKKKYTKRRSTEGGSRKSNNYLNRTRGADEKMQEV
jgi:hypothetical protein